MSITVSTKINRNEREANALSNVRLANDAHFHLTNHVQHGMTAQPYFQMVCEQVGLVAMFGMSLQRKWDDLVSGERAPD